jgi:fructosamine-3-kinase
VLDDVARVCGCRVAGAAPRPVSGGDINAAFRVGSDAGDLFIKTNAASRADMLTAEAEGLRALRATRTVVVPAVIGSGVAGATSWLALEWLDFRRPRPADHAALGSLLAELHGAHGERFGWHRDNTIGSTPQYNAPADDWREFFVARRLRPQLELAARQGFGELAALGSRALERIGALLAAHAPPPSLLHGDLWGGNWAATARGPALFDPATYYGDRETDLAMTRLFGGFDARFYDAYAERAPLPGGAGERQPVYQLYHLLNHLNLFGGGYAASCEAVLRRFA